MRIAIVRCLAAIVLVGAAFNVALAVGLSGAAQDADWVPALLKRGYKYVSPAQVHSSPQTLRFSDFPSTSEIRGESLGFDQSYTFSLPESADDGMTVTIETRSGWPFKSIRDASTYYESAETGNSGVPAFLDVVVIPLRPMWGGFVANTLLYAAMLWIALALPRQLRHRLRLKRGMCPACAYPMETGDRCTECGEPLQRNKGLPTQP